MSKNDQEKSAKKQPTEAEKAQRQKERQESFKRLATKRVNKIIKAYDLIGNLASYKPTMEQAAAIENALVKSHNDCVSRLKGTAKTAGTFTL